jgi:hypothetical protein
MSCQPHGLKECQTRRGREAGVFEIRLPQRIYTYKHQAIDSIYLYICFMYTHMERYRRVQDRQSLATILCGLVFSASMQSIPGNRVGWRRRRRKRRKKIFTTDFISDCDAIIMSHVSVTLACLPSRVLILDPLLYAASIQYHH